MTCPLGQCEFAFGNQCNLARIDIQDFPPLFKDKQNGSINFSSFHSKIHIRFKQEANKNVCEISLATHFSVVNRETKQRYDHYIKHMALFFKLANNLMLLFLQRENALPAQTRLSSAPPQKKILSRRYFPVQSNLCFNTIRIDASNFINIIVPGTQHQWGGVGGRGGPAPSPPFHNSVQQRFLF